MKSVLSPNVMDIASDVAELALDSVLDEGILKNIPVFGWGAKLYGVASAVKERIFLNKVAKFLQASTDISDSEREEFHQKLASDPSFSQKVSENLVLLLDRQDNIDKAHLLGKVFSGYVRKEIEYEAFLRLAAAIERTFIGDLKNLEFYYQKIQSYDSKLGKPFTDFLNDDIAQILYNAGLVRSEGYAEDIYHTNGVGAQLIRLTKN